MIRKLGYSALVFVLFLGAAEMASRLFEARLIHGDKSTAKSGWQYEFFGSVFDWNEPDPDLLWRFKANLDNSLIKTNSRHLIGDEIPTDREPGSLRILLLGDSSPVGLGLKSYKQTFSEVLRYLLTVEFRGKREIEVINAAVSGYTSEQIRRFLELRGWDLHPDLVLLYCGNNDASISGSHTDQQLLESQKLKTVRSVLGHLALYRVIRAAIARPNRHSTEPVENLKLRVPPARFAENLTSIARQCRDHSCPLIVIKPPVPYLWPAGLQFRAFQHVKGRSGYAILPDAMARIIGRKVKYCFNEKMFHDLYGKGDLFTREVYASAFHDSVPPAEAAQIYTAVIDCGRQDPVIYNNLGVCYWEMGDYARADSVLNQARELFVAGTGPNPPPAVIAAGSPILYNIGVNLLSSSSNWDKELIDSASVARIYLDSALQADFFSLRIKRDYQDVIDSLSRELHFATVDLPKQFARNGQEGLFIDHCHPTAEGHWLIAELLSVKVPAVLESPQPKKLAHN